MLMLISTAPDPESANQDIDQFCSDPWETPDDAPVLRGETLLRNPGTRPDRQDGGRALWSWGSWEIGRCPETTINTGQLVGPAMRPSRGPRVGPCQPGLSWSQTKTGSCCFTQNPLGLPPAGLPRSEAGPEVCSPEQTSGPPSSLDQVGFNLCSVPPAGGGMRSVSCGEDDPQDQNPRTPPEHLPTGEERQEGREGGEEGGDQEVSKKRMTKKVAPGRKARGKMTTPGGGGGGGGGKSAELQLSKMDMLHLLGIMEGEVQAREDYISLLESDRGQQPAMLEAQYGASPGPVAALQALQRDRLLAHAPAPEEDVYQRPMEELDRLEQRQRDSYRRMLEQLLLAEKFHRRTVGDLDREKQKHSEFMTKSDDFTNLLEQERERTPER
ncbi:unnamed protein product [Arctogadus glacialis]